MSGGVRVRAGRAPSPPPLPHAAPQSARFPRPQHDHLDADARREAASKGYLPTRRGYAPGGLNITSAEWKLLILISLVAVFVRLYRISQPDSVVFDEVHFGKFASKYIKSQYFVDVHPPLAKLLITLSGFIFGYDGNFDFKDIGKVYEANVPYVAMRMVPALLGVATVPVAYLTLRALDCRATTALLASLFITFENGLVTQSRHILLDSPLVFFTALTVFFWTCFCNEDKHEPFTETWWAWLVFSGLSLGAVVSCKWVGLFTIATVGVSTLRQLWTLLGDLRVSPRLFMRHFMARAICLILVPMLFYMFIFWIHFIILQNPGDGDGFMSSEFQHTLNGRGMADTFADIGIGSKVTIRHVNTQGGYLHSHPSNYPSGSKQQQITLYPHRDTNNEWRVLNATRDGDPDHDWEGKPLAFIEHGMKIKLKHITTDKHLHSHDHRAPVSDVDFQNEVAGYGVPGYAGDANDDWVVEISEGDKRDRESSKRLRTLRTHFRLRHAMSGCYLFSHKVKLPEWGFEQQEVTCNKQAVKLNSLWFVETAEHPMLPADAPKVNYKLPGFFRKFLELQQVMWTTNAGLTDRHTFDSRPESWPRLRRGINFWVKDHRQIYLLGNPMVWWFSTASVFAYIVTRGFLVLRAQRGYRDFESTHVVKYDTLCGFLFVGWLLHYFPFYIMKRQLFLHHYFPALYFAILLSCGVFDLVTSTLKPRIRLQIAAVLLIVVIWNFVYLSPIAYGNSWTRKKCENAKWLKTWDLACNEFYDDTSLYNTLPATPQKSAAVPTAEQVVPPVQQEPVNAKNVPADEEKAAETSADFGQAEPGRNVFEGVLHEELKSKAENLPVKASEDAAAAQPTDLPPPPIEYADPEPKHEGKPAAEAAAGADAAAEKPAAPAAHKHSDDEDANPRVEEVLAQMSQVMAKVEAVLAEEKKQDDTGVDPVIPGTEPEKEGEGETPQRAQGAQQEEEAEADRVRGELFPDAHLD